MRPCTDAVPTRFEQRPAKRGLDQHAAVADRGQQMLHPAGIPVLPRGIRLGRRGEQIGRRSQPERRGGRAAQELTAIEGVHERLPQFLGHRPQ
jgi:hypothetical protein